MSEDANYVDMNPDAENKCICCGIRMIAQSLIYPAGGLACSCSYQICVCGRCFGCCRCTVRLQRPYKSNTQKIERAVINKEDIQFLKRMNIKY